MHITLRVGDFLTAVALRLHCCATTVAGLPNAHEDKRQKSNFLHNELVLLFGSVTSGGEIQ
ncbi:hypothetical protein O5269_28685, partial [Escherichia coli]|nr:hypothetical protein [Escherichia coli]